MSLKSKFHPAINPSLGESALGAPTAVFSSPLQFPAALSPTGVVEPSSGISDDDANNYIHLCESRKAIWKESREQPALQEYKSMGLRTV